MVLFSICVRFMEKWVGMLVLLSVVKIELLIMVLLVRVMIFGFGVMICVDNCLLKIILI